MSLPLLIYIAGVSQNLQGVFVVFAATLGFTFTIGNVIKAMISEDNFEVMWWPLWGCIAFSLGGALLPSQKTMYTMLAAYGVEQVAANPNVQQIAGDSLSVLEKAMHEYLNKDKARIKNNGDERW